MTLPTKPLSQAEIDACRHPRQPLRFALAFICTLLLAPLFIVFSLFGAVTLILLWIIAFVWLAREILYANFTNNFIMVSELNYPRINTLAGEMKSLLNVRRDFSVFVYEQGDFNAFMMRLFRRRAIFLNSEILESGVSDDEVRWIVGRFVGYWRSQQDAGLAGWMIRMAERFGVFNLVILPYERAMVYTGDRLGLAGIGGDIGTAISAMQKLLVGRQLGYSVNPVGLVEQRRKTKGSLFAFLARLPSRFPHTVTRYVDLIAFARRRFPESFGRFEAANPGLTNDLDQLSGERSSGKSILKAIGYYFGLVFALILTIAFWLMLAVFIGRATNGESPFDNLPNFFSSGENVTPSPTPEPAPSPPPAPAPAPSPPPPAPTPPAQTNDGHLITDPIFAQAPSLADFNSVYPPAARAAGLSGTGMIQCNVASDGSLAACVPIAEQPPGSGFGNAAIALKDKVRLAALDKQGVPVAGGIVKITVAFTAPH